MVKRERTKGQTMNCTALQRRRALNVIESRCSGRANAIRFYFVSAVCYRNPFLFINDLIPNMLALEIVMNVDYIRD